MIPPSRFRALWRLRACCTPWSWDQYFSVPLGATPLRAPTDLRFGGPLHRQLPNPPPTHPMALRFMKGSFQNPFNIQF